MRCVPVPVEDAVLGCRQGFWSKAKLDKWLDMARQQIVVELVDLRPVIHGFLVFDAHRSEDIMEDGVESNVAKTKLIGYEVLSCAWLSSRINVPG